MKAVAFLTHAVSRPPTQHLASGQTVCAVQADPATDTVKPSGLRFLSPEAAKRAAESTVKEEKLKVAKDGSAMWTEIEELAKLLREGQSRWEDIIPEDIDVRFKWAGLFHRRKRTPGKFMMRLKIPNGIVTSEMMRFFSQAVEKYGEAGCIDITTRQSIQLRGVVIEDCPDIFDNLHELGITSFMTGMDNVRNLVGSPIAGIDPEELFDTRELCANISDMITNNRAGNPQFSNLPRKFNICVSGSRDDFAHTHINDLGFIPVPHRETGEIGFNVVVGGLFSIKRNEMSVPLNLWIHPSNVVEFCRAVLTVFRDHGARVSRQSARFMYLVDQWGVDTLRERVLQAMAVPVDSIEAQPESEEVFHRRDVLGVHPQKQEGLFWLGVNVPVGRMSAHDALEIARLADRYSAGEIRLTVEQNVIFPNIKEKDLESLMAEDLIVSRFLPQPGNISRGLVSCTGSQFCGVAIIETKNRAMELAEVLEQELEMPNSVRIHWTGCPNSCGQAQVADIGLMGAPAKKDGKAVEGVNIFLHGRVGENPELAQMVRKGVPCHFDDLVPAMKDILKEHFGAVDKQN
uniref:Ferredoxin--nitrite reductase, chloroplastic n=1 Tax=Compsopogon caeruleus TaxID=31354 RepID=A0A7S1TF51_9RHOD|mmetsp:Transcript_4271/g.8372  ORF Transcript_4271/g.8372 Transcript_4271/m.8372 type:complete len:573 (+) Transcript_4271:1271-2989(+)